MSDRILTVENLTAGYGKQTIINGLSFEVNKGDYLGIVGSNGSGKTTLVKVLLGLLEPSGGHLEYAKGKTNLGYLPQKTLVNDSFFPAQVEEIVMTGLMGTVDFRTMKSSAKRERVIETLKLLNMSEFQKRKIGTLSIGQQQRVLLARALVSNPDLLILDEPTSALDPRIREEFYDMLHHLHLRHQVTIIQVSHDVTSMDKYMNKVLAMGFSEYIFGNYTDLKDSLHLEHGHSMVKEAIK